MEFVDSFQALRSLPITQHSRIWVRSCDIVKYIARSFTANYRFIPVSYMCVSFLLSTSVKVIGESTPSLNSSSVELVCERLTTLPVFFVKPSKELYVKFIKDGEVPKDGDFSMHQCCMADVITVHCWCQETALIAFRRYLMLEPDHVEVRRNHQKPVQSWHEMSCHERFFLGRSISPICEQLGFILSFTP